jgi:predicted DNA-binding WGR domain protein
MHAADDFPDDVELRLVDPSRNRFRIYGLTECRTLFGELCLRIVWGRIGNRRLRERSEIFPDRETLVRRRRELFGRRERHGYVSTSTPRAGSARPR